MLPQGINAWHSKKDDFPNYSTWTAELIWNCSVSATIKYHVHLWKHWTESKRENRKQTENI